MRVLNIIWAFSTGGIGKLFLTYNSLDKYDSDLNITSICIDLQNCDYDRKPLEDNGIIILPIKNRFDFSWIKQICKIADSIKPDVVFCHGFNGPVVIKISSLFSKSLRIPLVCTYHGLYNPPINIRKPLAKLINKTQAWLYKKYAHKVVLVSKYSGQYLTDNGVPKTKMEVIYNGLKPIETDISPIKLERNGISIGMTGRLDSIKGINYLLEAIKLVSRQVKQEFHVYIVGDGPEMKNLQMLANLLDIEDYVSFMGYQSNVSAWLKSWDIFCLPSLQENHSIALLEAMRAGNAIICTNVGGNPETVDNGKEALLVDAADPEAIASNLVKLIESPSIRNNLGCNAKYRFYKEFTEDIMKERLCKLLKSVAQS